MEREYGQESGDLRRPLASELPQKLIFHDPTRHWERGVISHLLASIPTPSFFPRLWEAKG